MWTIFFVLLCVPFNILSAFWIDKIWCKHVLRTHSIFHFSFIIIFIIELISTQIYNNGCHSAIFFFSLSIEVYLSNLTFDRFWWERKKRIGDIDNVIELLWKWWLVNIWMGDELNGYRNLYNNNWMTISFCYMTNVEWMSVTDIKQRRMWKGNGSKVLCHNEEPLNKRKKK